ncbi:MAG TPA: phosphoribosyltransferase family protein [Aggregatilineaceae bacterium]|nr:phosphoribosyltransferase family protein [Aggregatilineaceae bacterium]
MKSYDYSNREDILPISWNDFHGLCKALVQATARYNPQIILAVGRGGYYPGTLIAHLLQAEIFPIRLSRRVRDVVTYETPQWMVRPPELVKDQRVLVVDEISSSGETLNMVKAEVESLGAKEVRCAVLYAHTWGQAAPDYVGLISDALILNPWDREIFKDGVFQMNPEYVSALAQQGIEADESALIEAPHFEVAKKV